MSLNFATSIEKSTFLGKFPKKVVLIEAEPKTFVGKNARRKGRFLVAGVSNEANEISGHAPLIHILHKSEYTMKQLKVFKKLTLIHTREAETIEMKRSRRAK